AAAWCLATPRRAARWCCRAMSAHHSRGISRVKAADSCRDSSTFPPILVWWDSSWPGLSRPSSPRMTEQNCDSVSLGGALVAQRPRLGHQERAVLVEDV